MASGKLEDLGWPLANQTTKNFTSLSLDLTQKEGYQMFLMSVGQPTSQLSRGWTLASDWSRGFTWPGHWPLIGWDHLGPNYLAALPTSILFEYIIASTAGWDLRCFQNTWHCLHWAHSHTWPELRSRKRKWPKDMNKYLVTSWSHYYNLSNLSPWIKITYETFNGPELGPILRAFSFSWLQLKTVVLCLAGSHWMKIGPWINVLPSAASSHPK